MHSDYVYKDRKMMKWMPFNALLEQGDYVSELLYGKSKKEMPILSPDQLQELNYQLETAYVFGTEIIITYFNNHAFHTVQGTITRTDLQNKIIFLGNQSVHAIAITHIEIL